MLEFIAKFKRIFSEKYFLILLLILSSILNLFLALEIKNLKSNLTLFRNEIKEHQIILGKIVSPLNVQNLKGENITLKYSDVSKPTILYVFSPDCVWCERNLQNIKYLYEKTQNQYRFVGLSLQRESGMKYVEEKDIMFPVYLNPSDFNLREYNFRATPSTYIISQEGIVLSYWSGAYGGKAQNNIEEFFKIKLPGLSE